MTVFKNKEALINHEIKAGDAVLDVGFWGQGVGARDENWVHMLLKKTGADVWGLDLEFDPTGLVPADHYMRASAESFLIDKRFDVIFAGDLIEHLSNPGLFLSVARMHLAPGGRLIMTTPNCFNLFNMTEKLSKGEPTVNHDHTCYFNVKTLRQLLAKNGWELVRHDYVYTLGTKHKESIKKKTLNVLYRVIGLVTDTYMETLVITAVPAHASAPSA